MLTNQTITTSGLKNIEYFDKFTIISLWKIVLPRKNNVL